MIFTAISKIKKTDIDGYNVLTSRYDEKPVYFFNKKTDTISKIIMIDDTPYNNDIQVEVLIQNKVYKLQFHNLTEMKQDLIHFISDIVLNPSQWVNHIIIFNEKKVADIKIEVGQKFNSNKGNIVKITDIGKKLVYAEILEKDGSKTRTDLIKTLFKAQIIDGTMVLIQADTPKNRPKNTTKCMNIDCCSYDKKCNLNCNNWDDKSPYSCSEYKKEYFDLSEYKLLDNEVNEVNEVNKVNEDLKKIKFYLDTIGHLRGHDKPLLDVVKAGLWHLNRYERYLDALKNSEKLFLEYINDFLTVEKFAEYYSFTEEQAKNIIDTGRNQHDLKTQKLLDECNKKTTITRSVNENDK